MPAKFKPGQEVLICNVSTLDGEAKIIKRVMYWEEGKRHWIYKLKGFFGWYDEGSLSKRGRRA